MMENDYYVALSESSSSAFSKLDPNAGRPPPAADEDDELELGLSLRTNTLTAGRFKPNHRPPSPSSSVSSSERVSDPTDATAAAAAAAAAPANPPSQVVVGWPPVRASRMLSLFNQAKDGGEVKRREEKKRVGLVKVKMDGDPIGRKVDLNAHQSYKTLAAALEIMFHRPTTAISSSSSAHSITGSRLLDGSAEFALTYEDKDGDWMLVGDVPWGMFLDTVKRLRIMRTSDANGLAPRFQTSIGGLLGKRSIA